MGNRGERVAARRRALAAILAVLAAAGTGCHEVNKVAWTPELTVCGVSPTLGPMQGGTLVTAFGIDFRPGATVTVAGEKEFPGPTCTV